MAITDLDGRFEGTNTAYQLIVGRSREQLDPETIFSITHEDDREGCRDNLHSVKRPLPALLYGQVYRICFFKDVNSVCVRNWRHTNIRSTPIEQGATSIY